ncbi:MAG TPA: DUF6164 family protein [Mariprofundaceae bacterium]|nr:DUF6164 family protein [Mariprofundaceae bacterium]
MRIRLFSLSHVPEDEAEDIRQLLNEHEIDFYETQASGWGISTPAIWLHDEVRQEQARALIDAYQEQRFKQARAEHEALYAAGQHKTLSDRIRENPVQVAVFVLFILFILYVSLSPFLHFLE